MASGSHLSYNVPQPIQPADGIPRWTKARIERAPDSGTGTPGAFATLATVTLNLAARWAYQYDDSDSLVGTEWYRHVYLDAAGNESDASDGIQVNEFTVILWLFSDIPDSALDADQVKQWVDQAITDMWPLFWIRRREAIVPYDIDGDGVVDERYPIPAELYEVCRVEKVSKRTTKTISAATNATPIVVTTSAAHGFVNGDRVYVSGAAGNTAANGSWVVDNKTSTTFELLGSAGNGAYTSGGTVRKTGSLHVAWQYMGTEWEQEDREIRIFDLGGAASSASTVVANSTSPVTAAHDYVLHGKQRIRDVRDLDEAWFQLVYWRARRAYLDWRVNKRADFVRFLVFDQRTDTKPEQLRMFLIDADAQVARREALLAPSEYPYDIAPAAAV